MTNLFDTFEGADIDRLNDCLKAVYSAGLKIDKYTHAGVNQNSGNVWVWSEDWEGCVFCTIGFDVWWMWTCPNCGHEFEFETYQEMADFAAEQGERTEHEGCEECCEVEI